MTGCETKVTDFPTRINKSWTLITLARGKTSGADKVLDWMASSCGLRPVLIELILKRQNVIMEGILGKRLSGVLFSIYADKNNPSQILESYKFSFQTSGNASGYSQALGLAFSGPQGQEVTITSARAGLKSIVEALRLVERQLPALPGQSAIQRMKIQNLTTSTSPSVHDVLSVSQTQQFTDFSTCRILPVPEPHIRPPR